MTNKFCGIDFGTTNSAVSYRGKDGNFILTKFHNNKETIPTAIFFPENETDTILYGTPAIEQYINGTQGRFMRSMKRILGTDLMSLKTEINNSYLSYENIILDFIKYIKTKAEQQAGFELDSVVLGRPVHFQDFNPEADIEAEKMLRKIAISVGFKNVNFQYEPIAAAYAHEINLDSEKLACVIDIGGGTSDFSIVKLGPQKSKKDTRQSDILANTGIRVGGNDFDNDLSIKCFMPKFGYGTMLKPDAYTNRVLPMPFSPYVTLSEWSSVNTLYTYKEQKNIRKLYEQSAEPEKVKYLYEIVSKEYGHNLLNKVEESKVRLTDVENIIANLEFLSDSPKIPVIKQDFENAINKDVSKIEDSINECLQQSSISSNDVELIILTGGSTSIPYIKQKIKTIFPSAGISEENKFSSVATGLVYEAARLYR